MKCVSRRLTWGLAWSLTFGLAPSVAQEIIQKKPVEPIQVFILGTYHFAQVEPEDEMLSPMRQEQLAEVLERLEEFAPEKIFVERQPEFEYANRVQEKYLEYVAKDHPLSANEIYQIGFRLAKTLGHEAIYPCDHPGMYGVWHGKARDWAESNHQMDIMNGQAPGTTLGLYRTQDEDKIYRDSTVLEYLRRLNSPQFQRADHASYLTIYPQIGDTKFPTTEEEAKQKDYDNEYFVGTALVASWYRRNLMIYAKILSQLSYEEERILVVYGNGHASTLKHFFQSNPHFILEDLTEWLEE